VNDPSSATVTRYSSWRSVGITQDYGHQSFKVLELSPQRENTAPMTTTVRGVGD
jgi:hypothetical protein